VTARYFPEGAARRRRIGVMIAIGIWCALVGSCAAVLWYTFATWSGR